MKVIIAETHLEAKYFEQFIGEKIADYKFHVAGTTGYIIPLIGFNPGKMDPFNGKGKTFTKLLGDASEIIVATHFTHHGEMLFYVTRDLLELNITYYTRMEPINITDEAFLAKAWIHRRQNGTYEDKLRD